MNNRKVFLDGEAFFEVAHDPDKPFIVNTDKLAVQVLGTSFDIHNYAAEHTIAVTVATGKVGVSATHQKKNWMLTPGQQLSYHKKTGQATKNTVNPNDYTAWQKEELIFKNEPLEKICKRLERWYAVKISIKTAALKNKLIPFKDKILILKKKGLLFYEQSFKISEDNPLCTPEYIINKAI